MLVQENAHSLTAQGDPCLLRQVARKQVTGSDRLLQTKPARIVTHCLDQKGLVGLIPGWRASIAPLDDQALKTIGLKAIQPAMDCGIVNVQQLTDLGYPPTVGREQDGLASMHPANVLRAPNETCSCRARSQSQTGGVGARLSWLC